MTSYRERHLAGLTTHKPEPTVPHVPESPEPGTDVSWTDAAKELADEHGIDMLEITGTGLHGKITKGDVEGFMMGADE